MDSGSKPTPSRTHGPPTLACTNNQLPPSLSSYKYMQRKRKSDHNRHCMEEEEATMRRSSSGSGSNASSVPNSRWNPTNEQISLLETLYKQGVRTPTAEQIQEIAGKLREYGSIEGKNVFYWFQNHKARQRQKQKQETMACFNRLLRKTTLSVSPVSLLPHQRAIASLPPPVCANGMFGI